MLSGNTTGTASKDEGINPADQRFVRTVQTSDGEAAGEEYATDERMYQALQDKIETLLDRLKLDA